MNAERTRQYRPVLEAMHRGEAVTQSAPGDGFASKGELRALRSEMRGVKEAIEGVHIKAENKLDRDGMRQVIETTQNIERVKFRG